MKTTQDARERLQGTLVRVNRTELRRRPTGRRVSTRPVREPRSSGEPMEGPGEPLADSPARPAPPEGPTPPPRQADPAPDVLSRVEEVVSRLRLPEELHERLDRIERRLSVAANGRADQVEARASREAFSEWVRLRRWESMPFAEFLKLRRAGRI